MINSRDHIAREQSCFLEQTSTFALHFDSSTMKEESCAKSFGGFTKVYSHNRLDASKIVANSRTVATFFELEEGGSRQTLRDIASLNPYFTLNLPFDR